MNAENLGMTLSHSAALEVRRCVTIGIYPSWVSNAINYGGRVTRGQTRKITVNGGKNWLIPILESFKLCQRLTTSVMTGSDILRRKLKNDVTREGIPSRITKPSAFS